MPSDTELEDYASTLPAIYRDIAAAFPEIEPGRKAGYGLAFQTLAAHFANTRRGYGFGDVREACVRLAQGGFFDIKIGSSFTRQSLGSDLIAAATGGAVATRSAIPQLPARTW